MAIERNETTTTAVFAAVAVVLAIVAYTTRTAPNLTRAEDVEVGKPFFPNLTLEQIKGLEITDFDPKAAKTDVFRVDYEKGGWVLPLKEGYPADAKEALGKATSWLTSVSRDVKVTSDRAQQRDLGVVSPTAEAGSEGLGILFRALDENKNVIAELVIGKEVEGKTGWRYVREPNSDIVYRANVGDFSVSTRFRDWIEKDLLELADSARTMSSASEAQREKFKKTLAQAQWTDYKFSVQQQIIAKVTSKASELLKFTGGSEWSPTAELQGLGPDQETNSEKVRDLSDALRNMQIVDVFPKPPGLGPDLRLVRREISEADQVNLVQLAQRGFLPTAEGDIVPTGGELRVESKEGIFYRLRFGVRALISEDGKTIGAQPDDAAADAKKAPAKDEKATPKKDASKKGAGDDKPKEESRFVLIAAGFDESKFPPVVDQPEPKLPTPKPGEKTDEAENKKRLEEIHQLQKMQTEQAKKKRDKDIENGKLRAKELSDRYDHWYYVVSNDTYKKLKIDKTSFAKAKEAKKDDKPAGAAGIPGLPGDLGKSDAPPTNPNVPAPPKKEEPTKDDGKKEAPKQAEPSASKADVKKGGSTKPTETKAAGDAKSSPAGPKQPTAPAKEGGKTADPAKSKDGPPAKKGPSP